MIKRSFLTGLALLLPVVVTVVIVLFFINLLTRPFQKGIEDILSHYGLMGKTILFLNADQALMLISKGLVILILVIITILVGFLGELFVTNYVIRIGDKLLHKIPLVNKVYKSAQEVVKTLFSENRQTFSQIVLVPFPHDRAYSIGMVTKEGVSEQGASEHEGLVSVFVPATPNPTMGFMLLLNKNSLIFTDMKVDEALQAIISCGVILGERKQAD